MQRLKEGRPRVCIVAPFAGRATTVYAMNECVLIRLTPTDTRCSLLIVSKG